VVSSYEVCLARWRESVARAEAELAVLEALKKRFLEVHGVEACDYAFYGELLARIRDARRRALAPPPDVDEEFNARW